MSNALEAGQTGGVPTAATIRGGEATGTALGGGGGGGGGHEDRRETPSPYLAKFFTGAIDRAAADRDRAAASLTASNAAAAPAASASAVPPPSPPSPPPPPPSPPPPPPLPAATALAAASACSAPYNSPLRLYVLIESPASELVERQAARETWMRWCSDGANPAPTAGSGPSSGSAANSTDSALRGTGSSRLRGVSCVFFTTSSPQTRAEALANRDMVLFGGGRGGGDPTGGGALPPCGTALATNPPSSNAKLLVGCVVTKADRPAVKPANMGPKYRLAGDRAPGGPAPRPLPKRPAPRLLSAERQWMMGWTAQVRY